MSNRRGSERIKKIHREANSRAAHELREIRDGQKRRDRRAGKKLPLEIPLG